MSIDIVILKMYLGHSKCAHNYCHPAASWCIANRPNNKENVSILMDKNNYNFCKRVTL